MPWSTLVLLIQHMNVTVSETKAFLSDLYAPPLPYRISIELPGNVVIRFTIIHAGSAAHQHSRSGRDCCSVG